MAKKSLLKINVQACVDVWECVKVLWNSLKISPSFQAKKYLIIIALCWAELWWQFPTVHAKLGQNAQENTNGMLELYLNCITNNKRNREMENGVRHKSKLGKRRGSEAAYEEEERLCPWVNIGFADIVFMNKASDKRGWWDSWFNLLTSLTQAILRVKDESEKEKHDAKCVVRLQHTADVGKIWFQVLRKQWT